MIFSWWPLGQYSSIAIVFSVGTAACCCCEICDSSATAALIALSLSLEVSAIFKDASITKKRRGQQDMKDYFKSFENQNDSLHMQFKLKLYFYSRYSVTFLIQISLILIHW
ncbi:hypothetical protein FGO68_gene16767 [Halteria grandinella]|uniref:Uncharacterized protein n=1 Tax=Halteria grandinella TaxID=5974 RepID=A0A8J8NE77_HALGN|nr:hypothetical protein FGO68_gene16767 [Halteria grandinella]